MPAERMSFSKNLMASATCSIKLANDARMSATRKRPSSCSNGPPARITGLAFGATRSSTRNGGPGGKIGCGACTRSGVEIHSSDGWLVGAEAWLVLCGTGDGGGEGKPGEGRGDGE